MAQSSVKTWVDVVVWAIVAWVLYKKVRFFFFPYKQALSRYRRSPRAYAIITGASAGIGYGFAQELIAHGFGVILIASRRERLDAAAQRLQTEYPGAAVKTIVYNAQDVDGEELASALKPIMNLPITILINNVGGLSLDPPFQSLVNFPPDHVIKTINMNTTFMAQLTRIMIPVLNRNGPSVVVGMSSTGEIGAPWMVLFSACKGFVKSFSTALARESKAEGWRIDSLGLVVGEVYSEFNAEGLSASAPTSRQFAKIALDRIEIAVDQGKWVISPHWPHALTITLCEAFPEWLLQKLMTDGMSKQKKLRAKGQ